MIEFKYKQLIVWQKSKVLVKMVYEATEHLPKSEEFILKNQLRRAAVSVCSNIAEGSSRKSLQERKRFYEIARSSAIEIDAQLELCITLNYTVEDTIEELNKILLEVFKMLSKMIDQ